MSHELTNLLPPEKKRAMRREYFLRLGVVALVLLAFATIAGGVMLLPSYLAFTQEMRAKETQLAQLEAVLASAQEREFGDRIAQLSADATHLMTLEAHPSGSAAVRAILAVPRDGISLTRFEFDPGAAGKNSMTLSGTASTREALRAFNLALSELPFVESSDLPISTYAKETDLDFMITLTGTLTP